MPNIQRVVAHLNGSAHLLSPSLQSHAKQIASEPLLLHLYLAAACPFDLSAFLGPDDDLLFDLWPTFNSELNV